MNSCKCGREIKCQKTGECSRCYSRRKYNEAKARTEAWRHKKCIRKYRPETESKAKADNKKILTLLCTLAKRECDNCQERDCADCWAKDYK